MRNTRFSRRAMLKASAAIGAGVVKGGYVLVEAPDGELITSAETARAAGKVRLEVRDDGGPGGGQAPRAGLGKGHGITGMRERVRLYRGTLRAGPRPGGGYEVAASLPASAEATVAA